MITIILSILLGLSLAGAFGWVGNDSQASTKRVIKFKALLAVLTSRQFFIVTDTKTAAMCGEDFMNHVRDRVGEARDHADHAHEAETENKWTKVK